MRNGYSHIIKKPYQKPLIEEFLLDRELSLAMESPPGDPDDGGGGEWGDGGPNSVAPPAPDYGTGSEKAANPFGGSKPAY